MNDNHGRSDKSDIREVVRVAYGNIASQHGSCCSSSSCCGNSAPDSLAEAIGYTMNDLAGLPEGSNMGLSCGNPTAIASLKPGDVVLDLGSGGGFDAFIAARKVGSTGRVIGVDMIPEMIAKARKNNELFKVSSGLDNIEFRLGEIEHLPVADATIDFVISNCALNLSPDKNQVWMEIARVLKPGGKVCISDLALLKSLPAEIKESIAALVGCIAGASLVSEIIEYIREAGLSEVNLVSHSEYIDQMQLAQDEVFNEIMAHLPAGSKPGDFVTSLMIEAFKPDN